ncbi:MAG: tripartite tricarboxylate transporter substrate binding protein [Betaproteobacteria bacterium]|nr:tripartite tricarboxylate transporter substrate binding protein [Betaproteobacteria bacterium]
MRTKSLAAANPLVLCALTACLLAASTAAPAQDYPTRPMRLIVPTAPGGGTDISARIIAPKLSELLGQQVVVENRAGGNTAVGNEYVAKSPADGYTLLMGISSIAINPHTQSKVPYHPIKDFAPISQAVIVPLVLASHPSLPPRNLKELIAFTRARPGQLNYGTGSVGSNPHLAMELFLTMAGLKVTHVPYRGQGPAMIDLLAGHMQLMMANLLTALPHMRNCRIRSHGVSSAKRSPVATDIPTIAEAGVPGYEVVQWFGILAPASTPGEVIAKLHSATVRALQDPVVKKRFLADGAETIGNSPEQFAAIIRADLAKWGKLVKQAGIKPDTR